jgi:phosphopantetheine adenylyltransferase
MLYEFNTNGMKHKLVLLFFCGLLSLAGQEKTLEKKLENFKEVKVFDGLSVNLIRSKENRAVLKGEDTDKVVMVNNDGVLKIRMQITKFFSGYKTFIDLYYNEDLVVLDVNEDAIMGSADVLKQDILELKAQEGGELNISAEVEQMLIKAVSGGHIETQGLTNVQDVQINTGGVYEGKKFKSKFSTINVNAGSRAEVYASEYVKATVKAGGEVLIYGNPPKLEEKTVFGGVIRKM